MKTVGESLPNFSTVFLFDACWWRSHDVLFSVNSVHGLNWNVLLTAQWCAWMKKIMNYKFDGSRVFFLHPTPTSTTPISSGSATGLSRMYRTWMRRLLPIGTEWSVRGYRVPPGRFLSGRFCRMGKRTDEQAERENIPYFRQPLHQEPKAELHEILRADNDADVYRGG